MRKFLLHWLASKLLPLVEAEDLLVIIKKKGYLRGVEMTPEQIKTLKSEAKYFEQSNIWQLIRNDLEKIAQKKMYKEATDEVGILFSKSVLYTLDVQKNILEKIKQLD